MFAAWMLGARFDLAWKEITSGNLRPPSHYKEQGKIHGDL
jgi:farnesyl-diphosphate farnesyltransferase